MSAIVDPLAGLALPPGDPAALWAAAGVYSAAGGALAASAAQQTQAVSGVVGSAWLGAGAVSCSDAVARCSSITTGVGDAADAATIALRACASGWQDAQALWRQAQSLAAEAVIEESAHRGLAAAAGAVAAVANDTAAVASDAAAASGADGFQSPARAQALAMGRQAVEVFNQATIRALAALAAADAMLAGAATAGGGSGAVLLVANSGGPTISVGRYYTELLNSSGMVPIYADGYLSDACLSDYLCFAKSGRWNPEQTAQSYAISTLSVAPSTAPNLHGVSSRNLSESVMWEVSPNKGRPSGSQAAEFAGQGPNQGIVWFKSQRNRGTQTPATPPRGGGLLGQVGNLLRHLFPIGVPGVGSDPIVEFPVVPVP